MPDTVHEVGLDNGFRALLVERHSLPVVASTLWYSVGARDEGTGETGVSHFLEHMMFKGTSRYAKGQIDLMTAKLGGSNNAFTSADATAYYFALAADRWETALEIEASRMTDCLLDPAEFAAEKSVVLEELAQGEDDPWTVLHHAAESLAFRVHPYHHPVIGWREDLERLTVEGMRAYYRRQYGPNRALLVVAGDFEPRRAEGRIRELFGALPATAAPRAPVLAEPPAKGRRHAIERFPAQGEVARLALCVPSCHMGDDDDYVLDVIAHVLGGSKTGRLYRRLVLEDQIATDVGVANESRLDPGLFCVSIELREGVVPERGERAVAEEIERLAAQGPTAAELRAARTQLRAGFLFEEETVLEVALRLGRFETLCRGGYRVLESVLDRYAQVGARTVKDAAARYFAPDQWTSVWLLPKVEPTRRAPRRRPPPRPRPRRGSRRPR